MRFWRRLVGDRPIVTRLVLAVAATMTVVLLAAGAFVFWRVAFALNRQLNQDLTAYREVVEKAVAEGTLPPANTPGQSYQVYDRRGRVIGGDASRRLASRQVVIETFHGRPHRDDVGRLLPPADYPYRFMTAHVTTPDRSVVVASAISRHKHDEALRELLAQLAIADLVTLAAATAVGYGTARAALNPVEQYRRAAEHADTAVSLPVADDRDDEVTRLGHTFNALLRRIDDANTRERQFLADASHELRSPLALMRTELEVAALETQDESGQAATYASLRRQVERLIGVSNALLDLEEMRATTDGEHAAAAAERVDLSVLVESVARRFEPDVQAAARRLATSVPPGLALTGNERWIELAISNLVTNALRHGAGTINLDVDQDPARESVGITVTDEGPGFPPEFVHQAFDRFTRADTSRTTRGTGLGLALVQAVAEAHGGNARIDGASVTLRLPCRPDPPTGTSEEHSQPPVRTPTPDRHRAKGIA